MTNGGGGGGIILRSLVLVLMWSWSLWSAPGDAGHPSEPCPKPQRHIGPWRSDSFHHQFKEQFLFSPSGSLFKPQAPAPG